MCHAWLAAQPRLRPMNSIQERRARAYLARMPHSVSGHGGHNHAFMAAIALTKGFALSLDEAYPLLAEWNSRCLPLWTERELRHKLTDAASSSRQASGYLLSNVLARPIEGRTRGVKDNARGNASHRPQWPTFRPLKDSGIRMIANLRGIPDAAVDLASRRGLLKGAWVDGHRCFIIHEGEFAQARRFDGKPLRLKDGGQIKSKNLKGSTGAFIGASHLGQARHVLLVEGAIGLLEAYAALLVADCPQDWAAIASSSSSSRFIRAPELLEQLAGRHVRIVADSDEAGMNGASTWLGDLEAVGCTVRAFTVPEGYKDLGDLVKRPELHLAELKQLFQ